jgi:heat shock protein HslJ
MVEDVRGAKMIATGLAAAVAISLAGCGSVSDDSGVRSSVARYINPPRPNMHSLRLSHPTQERSYTATSVEDGRRGTVVSRPTDIQIWTAKWKGRRVMSWEINCNATSAKLIIEKHSFVVRPTTYTGAACPPGTNREDRWLEAFLTATPHWRRSGDQFTLTAGQKMLKLREQHSRPKVKARI